MRGEFTDAVFVRVGRVHLPEARRYWKIGEVCLILGETAVTIRHWDAWHMPPVTRGRRSRSGHRLYLRVDVERFRVVQACARLGITHEAIRNVLALRRWAWLDPEPTKENRTDEPL